MRARGIALLLVAASLAACQFDSPEHAPPNADPQAGCAIDCHGDELSNAPPKSMSGATETTSVAVGAHRAHLNVAPTWHRQVACSDCHVVPAEVASSGHLDGDGKAEVIFATIAGDATWNGTTCTTRCHGSAELGGAQPAPIWTRVDGAQVTCGSCHGRPPPAPHPNDERCANCHPTMEVGSMTFRDPESHINGVVDVTDPGATGGCTTCHGSDAGSAPPRDLAGNMVATARGVGAHAAHLGPSPWHREIQCSSCHRVPRTADAPGHRDGDNVAEVRFDALNPNGAYAGTSCTNLYCHGNGRDSNGSKSWVTPGALACGACHSMTGPGMSGQHSTHLVGQNMKCADCHRTVVDANNNFLNANLHVNGVHEVRLVNGFWDPVRRRCMQACHGTRDW